MLKIRMILLSTLGVAGFTSTLQYIQAAEGGVASPLWGGAEGSGRCPTCGVPCPSWGCGTPPWQNPPEEPIEEPAPFPGGPGEGWRGGQSGIGPMQPQPAQPRNTGSRFAKQKKGKPGNRSLSNHKQELIRLSEELIQRAREILAHAEALP